MKSKFNEVRLPNRMGDYLFAINGISGGCVIGGYFDQSKKYPKSILIGVKGKNTEDVLIQIYEKLRTGGFLSANSYDIDWGE